VIDSNGKYLHLPTEIASVTGGLLFRTHTFAGARPEPARNGRELALLFKLLAHGSIAHRSIVRQDRVILCKSDWHELGAWTVFGI